MLRTFLSVLISGFGLSLASNDAPAQSPMAEIVFDRSEKTLHISDRISSARSRSFLVQLSVSKHGASGSIASNQSKKIDMVPDQIFQPNRITISLQADDRIEAHLTIKSGDEIVLRKRRQSTYKNGALVNDKQL